ncbi:MAG: hypothetical protein M3P40_08685 [Actinomycetota bacterium]|nr:hypothetical protein [Actinomycetota bacterium]
MDDKDMKFAQQDSGVPTTSPERPTEPAQPSHSAVEPTDPDLARTSGAGPDPSPSFQTGLPSEGVSESTPGDGL